MKLINPLKEMQMNSSIENITRYLEASKYLERMLLNKCKMLQIFQESEKSLGYFLDPYYVSSHILNVYRVFLSFNMSPWLNYRNKNSALSSTDIDNIVFSAYNSMNNNQEMMDKYEEPVLIKKYDLLITYKDYTSITQERIEEFIYRECIIYHEQIHINVINIDTIIKNSAKKLLIEDFIIMEQLVFSLKQTLPIFYKMSSYDPNMKELNIKIKDLQENLCVFCQKTDVITTNSLKEDLNHELKNNVEKLKIKDDYYNIEHNFILAASDIKMLNPKTKITFTFVNKSKEETCEYYKNNLVNDILYFNLEKNMIIDALKKRPRKRIKNEENETNEKII